MRHTLLKARFAWPVYQEPRLRKSADELLKNHSWLRQVAGHEVAAASAAQSSPSENSGEDEDRDEDWDSEMGIDVSFTSPKPPSAETMDVQHFLTIDASVFDEGGLDSNKASDLEPNLLAGERNLLARYKEDPTEDEEFDSAFIGSVAGNTQTTLALRARVADYPDDPFADMKHVNDFEQKSGLERNKSNAAKLLRALSELQEDPDCESTHISCRDLLSTYASDRNQRRYLIDQHGVTPILALI